MVHFPWSPPPLICARYVATCWANIGAHSTRPPAKPIHNVFFDFIESSLRHVPAQLYRCRSSAVILGRFMLRVRFAPSPTGYLHIGSARTFIFNWLYARRNGGTMILRIDDTDVERNTQESLDSIFEGLKWLDLNWDEFYRQSERGDLHRKAAEAILAKGFAYRDFTPAAAADDEDKDHAGGPWLFNPGMREMPKV